MEQAASFMDRAVDEAVRGLIKRASAQDILLDVIAAAVGRSHQKPELERAAGGALS